MINYIIFAKEKCLLIIKFRTLAAATCWYEHWLLSTYWQALNPCCGCILLHSMIPSASNSSSSSPSVSPILCSHVWNTTRASNPPNTIATSSLVLQNQGMIQCNRKKHVKELLPFPCGTCPTMHWPTALQTHPSPGSGVFHC